MPCRQKTKRDAMRAWKLTATAILAWALSTGCASVEYHRIAENTAAMEKAPGLEGVYRKPGFEIGSYGALGIETVERTDLACERELRSYLVDRFRMALEERELVSLVSVAPLGADAADADRLRFKIGITECDPGSGFVRWFFGMGSGRTDMQIEGQLTDAETGDVLFEFAERRAETGNPWFGVNLLVFSSEHYLKRSIRHIADSVAGYLADDPVGGRAIRRILY